MRTRARSSATSGSWSSLPTDGVQRSRNGRSRRRRRSDSGRRRAARGHHAQRWSKSGGNLDGGTMSQLGVEGLRAEREAVLTIFKSLSDDEWNASSDCTGWTVRDVAAHMAASQHGVADPTFMPDMSSGTEQAMEGPVAERRTWPIADVIAE